MKKLSRVRWTEEEDAFIAKHIKQNSYNGIPLNMSQMFEDLSDLLWNKFKNDRSPASINVRYHTHVKLVYEIFGFNNMKSAPRIERKGYEPVKITNVINGKKHVFIIYMDATKYPKEWLKA